MVNSHINNHWICPRAHCRAHFCCSSFVHQMLRVNMYLLHAMLSQIGFLSVYLAATSWWVNSINTKLITFTHTLWSSSCISLWPHCHLIFARLLMGLRAYMVLPEWLFFSKVNPSLSPHHSFKAFQWILMTCEDQLPQPGPTSDASHHTHPCPPVYSATGASWLSLPLGLCTC